MSSDLVRKLLSLFSAIAPDGGEGVIRALAELCGQLAPFDDGELVLSLVADRHRRSLTAETSPLAGEDVLGHLSAHPGVLRIDDLPGAELFPATREMLARRHLCAMLVVPIAFGDVRRGAVVLVSRKPCAFAGAPMQSLGPLACAAGMALQQALKMSGLHAEQESLRDEARRLRETVATATAESQTVARQRQEIEALRGELDRLLAENESADDAEPDIGVVTRERDEALGALAALRQRHAQLESAAEGWQRAAEHGHECERQAAALRREIEMLRAAAPPTQAATDPAPFGAGDAPPSENSGRRRRRQS